MVRKQQDMFCVLCSEVPCACVTTTKKQAPKVARVATVEKKTITTQPPRLATPDISAPKRVGLLSAPPKKKEEPVKPTSDWVDSFDDAITALVQAGFLPTLVGDRRSFDEVFRPRLKLPLTDADIAVWKAKRQQWLRDRAAKQA